MNDSLRMNIVNSLKHLLKVVARDPFGESAWLHIVKKLSFRDELQNHKSDRYFFLVLLNLNAILLKLQKSYHVGVVKVLVNLNLLFYSL